MAASVRLPELTARQHSLLLDAIQTRIDYVRDEIKLGEDVFIENRKLRMEIAELNDLLEKIG